MKTQITYVDKYTKKGLLEQSQQNDFQLLKLNIEQKKKKKKKKIQQKKKKKKKKGKLERNPSQGELIYALIFLCRTTFLFIFVRVGGGGSIQPSVKTQAI